MDQSVINVVCVVDPKLTKLQKLQQTTNLEFNNHSKKYDLVYASLDRNDATGNGLVSNQKRSDSFGTVEAAKLRAR